MVLAIARLGYSCHLKSWLHKQVLHSSQSLWVCWHNDLFHAGCCRSHCACLHRVWRAEQPQLCSPSDTWVLRTAGFCFISVLHGKLDTPQLFHGFGFLFTCFQVPCHCVWSNKPICMHQSTIASFVWFNARFLMRTFWTFQQFFGEGSLAPVSAFQAEGSKGREHFSNKTDVTPRRQSEQLQTRVA